VNAVKIGDGVGPSWPLMQPCAGGDAVDVLQVVGECVGSTAQELTIRCVAAHDRFRPRGHGVPLRPGRAAFSLQRQDWAVRRTALVVAWHFLLVARQRQWA